MTDYTCNPNKFQMDFVLIRARQLGNSFDRAKISAEKLAAVLSDADVKVKSRLPRKFKKSLMKTIHNQL